MKTMGIGWLSFLLELPENLRTLGALSLSLWMAPEAAAIQEVVTAAGEPIGFDSLPFVLRWLLENE